MTSKITILNVDDSDATRYARSHILRRAGFDAIEAATGEDALRLVKECSPQLVLLDVRLPDASGIEICRTIKTDPDTSRIPVVQISSTYVTEADQTLGLEGGAEVYLAEPVEPRELLTVVRALLRLRSAEKGLRESEARWQRLFGANVIGIAVLHRERIVEANPVFRDMLGLEATDLDARSIELRAITAADFRAAQERALAELDAAGSFGAFEAELLRDDGGRVPVLISGATLNGDRERWMALVLDITERRRAEAEREELLRREQAARREAERAAQLKDEFLANLSHELRTPMSTITGWLHLMRSEQLSDQEYDRGLQAIERATRSQNQLIADLLDVSRIVAGKLSFEREPVELRGLLEASIESVAFDAAAKRIHLELDLAGAQCAVLGDRGRLQQVFWNLCNNAIKFTPEAGRVEVCAASDAASVTVTVGDTGQGISPEFLPHVFDRFRQADGSTVRRHGGMGLGLAIVRHLVELHGGRVSAYSPGEGKGATFTVQLPRAEANAGLASGASGLPPLDDAPLRGVRILLIEDDPDGREVIKALLARCGAECRVAASAVDGLAALDSWKFDVVISDIAMSEIDGYGFVERLRLRAPERGGSLPALALTAFAREEDRRRALASGYGAHIAKPVDLRQLVGAILRVTRGSQSGL